MRILCCVNRDLASNVALNLLLPALRAHDVRVYVTERVGSVSNDEPMERRELRIAEQVLPNETFFPLMERAGASDDGARYLTFAEIERYRGIAVTPWPKPNAPESVAAVRELGPDLILSVRYGAIFKSEVIGIPRFGVLNLHSGLLPKYRGVLATFRALLAGDTEIGCTLHFISDGTIDTGNIVAESRIEVRRDRSLLWHVLALYPAGVGLMTRALAQLASGEKIPCIAQPSDNAAYYSAPTTEEWAAFTRAGWRIADASDFDEVMRRYVADPQHAFGTTRQQ